MTGVPSTSASHMSLFTGLYPITHQVRFADDVLSDAIPTLAEILAAHGYQTGAVTENAMLSAGAGFSFGFDSYLENKGLGMWSTEGQLDSTLDAARRWLDRHGDDRFFLFLHTYQIHSPYEPLEKDVRPLTAEDRIEREGGVPRWVTDLRYRYAGEIRYADRALASFLRELERGGLWDETIVVLTSDHGEEFAEHDQIGHSKSAYEESLRIPLLVWAPGLIEPGVRIPEQVSLVDVVPTLLDFLKITPPTATQGQSLRAPLEGREFPGPHIHYAESPDIFNPGKRLVAVRSAAIRALSVVRVAACKLGASCQAPPSAQSRSAVTSVGAVGGSRPAGQATAPPQ